MLDWRNFIIKKFKIPNERIIDQIINRFGLPVHEITFKNPPQKIILIPNILLKHGIPKNATLIAIDGQYSRKCDLDYKPDSKFGLSPYGVAINDLSTLQYLWIQLYATSFLAADMGYRKN